MNGTLTTNLELHNVWQRICLVRGQQVMLDSDLATLYETETKKLNQAVKRRLPEFPTSYLFRLEEDEYAALTFEAQAIRHHRRGQHRKYLPFAFTEPGVAMLSGVLRSAKARHINILILETFIQMRKKQSIQEGLWSRLESKYDSHIQSILEAVKNLNTWNVQCNPEQPKHNDHFTLPAVPPVYPLCVDPDTSRKVRTIQKNVALHFHLETSDFQTTSRLRRFSVPKHIAIYLTRKHTTLSLKQIGIFFGGNDHSSILHACKNASTLIANNRYYQEALASIEGALQTTKSTESPQTRVEDPKA